MICGYHSFWKHLYHISFLIIKNKETLLGDRLGMLSVKALSRFCLSIWFKLTRIPKHIEELYIFFWASLIIIHHGSPEMLVHV